MKLYKNTYNLNGGSYQPKAIVVPTDSAYAIGVKFVKDGQPVDITKESATLVDGDTTLSASDVYHNYAVFEMEATSDENDDKAYSFRYNQYAEYDKTFTGKTGNPTTGAGKIRISEGLGTLPTNLNELNIDLHVDEVRYIGLPAIDISGKFNEITLPSGTEFPTVHSQSYDNVFISNKPVLNRGDKTTMYFVGKDATTGNVGWLNYQKSYEKAGQNITEEDFLTDYSPDTFMIQLNNLYQSCPYTLTLKKGETLVARFDNLIVNQKEDSVADYYPEETEQE